MATKWLVTQYFRGSREIEVEADTTHESIAIALAQAFPDEDWVTSMDITESIAEEI